MNRAKRGGTLLLVASVLALNACGGGSGENSGTVYVQSIDQDPRGLNAQLVAAPDTAMFSAQILDTLIRISDDYQLSPGLAESWEVSDDALELTLHLRQGVTWHDGQPFTAEDVTFNFEEILPLQVYGAALAERIDTVETPDESTVVVRMAEPYGPLLETVATQFMLPKHVYEGTEYISNEANMAPIGTGPMRFESYSSGEEVVLVKNPDYWEGEVQVDRAVYPIMADPNSRAQALFAGEVDQATLDPSQQDRVSEDDNTQLLERGLFPQVISAMFNARSEYLADPAVRAAVFAAIDRDDIVETALAGRGTPATGFFPDSLDWAVNPDINFDEQFPRDLAAINAALDDAGFERAPDGTRFTLNLRYISERSEIAAIAELVRSMLGEVGIGVQLTGTSAAIYTEKVYTEGDFDLSFLRSTVGADPSLGIVRWYVCNEERVASRNPSGICDDEIDRAAAAALDTADQAERGESFRALQSRAAELMYYAPVAWFNGAFPTINTSRWQGLDEPQAVTNQTPWLTMRPVDQ